MRIISEEMMLDFAIRWAQRFNESMMTTKDWRAQVVFDKQNVDMTGHREGGVATRHS